MISTQSLHNIELAFHKAIRANLVRAASDTCDIASVDPGSADEEPEHKLLLITISSFVFRLIVIFRIIDNPANRAYYLRLESLLTLEEEFAEVANMCSGALNRELSFQFTHLAMSTPCTVNSHCMAFLNDLRPQHVARYQVVINDSVQMQATLCMCCTRPVEVAAAAAAADQVDSGSGDLELF